MIKDIYSKLDKYLNTRIKREESVMYILVEIHKVLRKEDNHTDYHALTFFRDWVVHHQMDRKNTQIVLVDFIEKSNKTKVQFLTFEVLRLELGRFLTERELPTFLVEDGWFQFRRLLISILCDQPLLKIVDESSGGSIVYLKELRLKKLPSNFEKSFIEYSLIMSDGEDKGGSIMLGDYDEFAKREAELSDLRFRYHYMKKEFKALSARKRISKLTTDEALEIDSAIAISWNNLKEHEALMNELEERVYNDQLSDELYR